MPVPAFVSDLRQAPEGCHWQMGLAAHAGENSCGAAWLVRPAEVPSRPLWNIAFDSMSGTDSPALPHAGAAQKKNTLKRNNEKVRPGRKNFLNY